MSGETRHVTMSKHTLGMRGYIHLFVYICSSFFLGQALFYSPARLEKRGDGMAGRLSGSAFFGFLAFACFGSVAFVVGGKDGGRMGGKDVVYRIYDFTVHSLIP